MGKAKVEQKIRQMGKRYAVGWSTRLLKTGDPSDIVIVVVVVVVVVVVECCCFFKEYYC